MQKKQAASSLLELVDVVLPGVTVAEQELGDRRGPSSLFITAAVALLLEEKTSRGSHPRSRRPSKTQSPFPLTG